MTYKEAMQELKQWLHREASVSGTFTSLSYQNALEKLEELWGQCNKSQEDGSPDPMLEWHIDLLKDENEELKEIVAQLNKECNQLRSLLKSEVESNQKKLIQLRNMQKECDYYRVNNENLMAESKRRRDDFRNELAMLKRGKLFEEVQSLKRERDDLQNELAMLKHSLRKLAEDTDA